MDNNKKLKNMRVKQGEPAILEITVLDDNNQKVNLLPSVKLRVGLSVRGTIVKKYLDETVEYPISGYGHCEIDPLDFYKVNVYITREQSTGFPVGDLMATVLIDFSATGYESIVEYSYPVGSIEIGTLKLEDLTI